jgi:SNF2 family DNA or RNA helicase
LNVLEDYLMSRRYRYGRIDGDVKGEQRQAVIDKFSKPDSDLFLMVRTHRNRGKVGTPNT